METIPVVVKHQGKRHDVELDPTSTGEVFKMQLYSLTGVEPERQKILVKGGQLKDNTDLSKLGLKPGHVFMMMGTPSTGNDSADVLQRPKEKTRFVEDMTEAEAAQVAGATPAGLQNLGNTCYLNSTLQALKSVPELQIELARYKPSAGGASSSSSGLGDLSQFGLSGLGASMDLTASLRDLYQQMSETQEGFPPLMFLNALRTAFPQFAQRSKTGHGYAQQDAEEAWSQILTQLRQKLKIKGTDDASAEGDAAAAKKDREISFIDKYFAGKFETVTECDEASAKEAGEEPVNGEDVFLKLDCHIGLQTNHLRDGILAGLEEKIEKRSTVLGREAVYTKKSRISRLPKYLTVHFVRFFWKREAQKKAKIMRKVMFPHEMDVVEFCTEQLQSALVPVRNKIRDVRSDELDVERARKRQKRMERSEEADKDDQNKASSSVDGKQPKAEEPSKSKDQKKASTSTAGDTEMSDIPHKTDAEIEAERMASIMEAKRELLKLVDPTLASDDGANKTGLYELRGVVTHQGVSADSGHYTAYVKKEGSKDPSTGKRGDEDGKWWWFNDEKVSEVDEDKIIGLAGGGKRLRADFLGGYKLTQAIRRVPFGPDITLSGDPPSFY
ncbi:MAG: deubiquitinating enzyme [Peltula sp. TS41687]|nr:MAG: deubiquitinating enzyme [Peltula sp. TS41687]